MLIFSDKNKCHIFLNENLVITYQFCTTYFIENTYERPVIMFGSIFKNFKFYLRARKKRKEGRKEGEKVEGEKEEDNKLRQHGALYRIVLKSITIYISELIYLHRYITMDN